MFFIYFPAAQNEAFRCKTRPSNRKATFCTERPQQGIVGQCRWRPFRDPGRSVKLEPLDPTSGRANTPHPRQP
eukprot:2487136-Alexandrium_andersonii.AAC.1